MKKAKSFCSALLCMLLLASYAHTNENGEVIEASQSVHRIWVGQKLASLDNIALLFEILGAATDTEFTTAMGRQLKEKLDSNGYVSPGDGFIIFVHNNIAYLLLSSGSGFAVGGDHMLTNHHVIESILEDGKHGFVVQGKEGNRLKLKSFHIKKHDEHKDIAVLKVNGLETQPLVFSAESSIYITAAVNSIGFPGDSDILGGINDELGYFSAKIRAGTLISPHLESDTQRHTWEHDAAISGGNSGGPLVNQCGEVVGINTFGHVDNQSVLFAVAIENILPELTAENISFRRSSSQCSPNGIAFIWWLIGIILLSIIAAMAVFLFRIKAQVDRGHHPVYKSALINGVVDKIAASKMHSPEPEKAIDWQTDDHGREYRFDAVQGIVYRDQQPQQPQQPQQDPTPAQASATTADIHISTQNASLGQHRLNLGETITIGRGSDADISIDNTYLSERHLKISHTSNGLWVEDLNSRNGSFYQQQALQAPVAVNAPETFVLANVEHGIMVTVQPNSKPVPVAETSRQLRSSTLPPITLPIGQWVTLGRASDNTVALNNTNISNYHCRFYADNQGRVQLEDLNSSNGTYLDSLSNRISTTTLATGQTVYLADTDTSYSLAD